MKGKRGLASQGTPACSHLPSSLAACSLHSTCHAMAAGTLQARCGDTHAGARRACRLAIRLDRGPAGGLRALLQQRGQLERRFWQPAQAAPRAPVGRPPPLLPRARLHGAPGTWIQHGEVQRSTAAAGACRAADTQCARASWGGKRGGWPGRRLGGGGCCACGAHGRCPAHAPAASCLPCPLPPSAASSARLQKYRICAEHHRAPLLQLEAGPGRFCQQCSKPHPLAAFDGDRRSCRWGWGALLRPAGLRRSAAGA